MSNYLDSEDFPTITTPQINESPEDPVNHPKHYTSHPSGVEVITITRHMNFNIGNVFKYLMRAGIKDPSKNIEDHEKAAWYLNDEIKRLKDEQNKGT